MTELRKVRDLPDEVSWAHPYARGWIAVLLGAAALPLARTQLDGGGRWVAVLFAALFVVFGLWSVFYRFRLTLDLARGRLRYARGPAYRLETGDEPLDAVERVVLVKEVERRRGREVVDEWEVELEIRGWPRRVELFESKVEEEARAEAESLAERIGVPLEERTGAVGGRWPGGRRWPGGPAIA